MPVSSSTLKVRQVSLSDLVQEDVLLLKVDAAGYEDEILKGLIKTFNLFP